MGKVAADNADVAIVTSDNPRSEEPLAIIQDVLQGTGVDVEIDPDRRSAIGRAISLAEPATSSSSRARATSRVRTSAAWSRRSTIGRSRASCCGSGRDPCTDRRDRRARARSARPGRARSRPSRRTRARSGRATSSSRSTPASNTWARLERAARRRSSPTTRRPRSLRIASLVRAKSDAQVVAVVGSTGKTTTKDILGALCAPHAPTIWAERSLNNEIGLPLTVCRLEPETRVLVAEMGMRGLGQIAALCAVARPTLVVVPHVGPEHLELLGTVERVAEANAEAIAALPPGGTAVVPAVGPLDRFLTREDVVFRRFSAGRGRDVRRRDALRGGRQARRARASVHAAPSREQHARRAACVRRPRAPARAAPRRVSR